MIGMYRKVNEQVRDVDVGTIPADTVQNVTVLGIYHHHTCAPYTTSTS